ncbi:MAG: hypothetical protein ABL997_12370, partial [Planctomycetota bacterium]
ALAALCGCRGPTLTIESSHPVFVDGLQRDLRAPLPFRYYGDVLVDTVPGDVDGRPDWSKQPIRTEVQVARRTPAYLFPLDLPLDLLLWPWTGAGDQTVAVEPGTAPQQVALGFQPEGIEALRSRAFAARSER